MSIRARLAGQAPAAAAATALGAAIVLVRLLLDDSLGDKAPFILAWPATMLAAFLGGFWPALAVGLIGLWVGQDVMTSHAGPPLRVGGVGIYMAFVLVFAAAGGMRKRGLRRAKDAAERLSQMGSRLAQVARLNAMGEMAGTLAHELNQPLTAIASYAGAAQHLAGQEAKGPQIVELLGKVSDQALRAREIIGRIRSYVAGDELKLQEESLRAMFEEALAIVCAGEPARRLAVRHEFDPACDRVLADRVQAQQVMINLMRNAVEAMGGSPRAELRIGSRPGPDGFTEAYVADSGPGVPPEVTKQLFEPFVSGKAGGMGIGLSVSRSLVEAHGGRIWADTVPGDGAVFRFTLKRAV